MAPRAIATATVSFGMVSIPVKLYSAAESATGVSFNMLHKDCGSRLSQQYVCKKDGQVVARDQTVKGYEFSRDQYVIFTPEEIKELEEKNDSLAEQNAALALRTERLERRLAEVETRLKP